MQVKGGKRGMQGGGGGMQYASAGSPVVSCKVIKGGNAPMQGESSQSKEYLLDRGLHHSLAPIFKKLMGELNMKIWCQMVKLPGGENMSQSSPRWWFPDTFPRKNATFPRYGFPPPGKTVTPIAFS